MARASEGHGAAASGVFASFRVPRFRRVWLGAVLFALGFWMERLAVGWFVLDLTGSVLLAALSLGIRAIPNLVLGPVGGAVSDRLPRGRVLATTALVRAIAVALMSLVVIVDVATVPLLLALVLVTSSTLAFHITSLQALQAEIAGTTRLGNAISLTTFGERAVGAVGALGGGALIGWIGPEPTFLVAALPLAGAAVVFAGLRPPARPPGARAHLFREVLDGLRLLAGTPAVRLLLGMMIAVEILGISFASMLPAVAELRPRGRPGAPRRAHCRGGRGRDVRDRAARLRNRPAAAWADAGRGVRDARSARGRARELDDILALGRRHRRYRRFGRDGRHAAMDHAAGERGR